MTQLPIILRPYGKQAKRIVDAGFVRDLEFSGETYQVQVFDPETNKEVWAFLQLDPKGQIRDCFCSCEEETEEHPYCPHIAAAYLKIFNNTSLPLHQRFKNSLWEKLCRAYSGHLGTDPDELLKKNPGQYQGKAPDGETSFTIKAKSENSKTFLTKI